MINELGRRPELPSADLMVEVAMVVAGRWSEENKGEMSKKRMWSENRMLFSLSVTQDTADGLGK